MFQSLEFEACHENGGKIGNKSCIGKVACYANGFVIANEIGKGSCLGPSACENNEGNVGDGSWYVQSLFTKLAVVFLASLLTHFYLFLIAVFLRVKIPMAEMQKQLVTIIQVLLRMEVVWKVMHAQTIKAILEREVGTCNDRWL